MKLCEDRRKLFGRIMLLTVSNRIIWSGNAKDGFSARYNGLALNIWKKEDGNSELYIWIKDGNGRLLICGKGVSQIIGVIEKQSGRLLNEDFLEIIRNYCEPEPYEENEELIKRATKILE